MKEQELEIMDKEELLGIIKAQKFEIERLKEDYAKEKYLVDKYTRQLTDEYKNTEYQCKEKDRLNNIINELEDYMIGKDIYKILLYKLRDLKEGDFE